MVKVYRCRIRISTAAAGLSLVERPDQQTVTLGIGDLDAFDTLLIALAFLRPTAAIAHGNFRIAEGGTDRAQRGVEMDLGRMTGLRTDNDARTAQPSIGGRDD